LDHLLPWSVRTEQGHRGHGDGALAVGLGWDELDGLGCLPAGGGGCTTRALAGGAKGRPAVAGRATADPAVRAGPRARAGR
jgi:hypothetical protein